jgi:hypothetical protein
MKKHKLIFICSPLRGNIKSNISRAKQYCKLITKLNHIPICPHIYFTQFLDDSILEERMLGMSMGKKLLLLCDEIWIFGNTISEGMKKEITYAKRHNIKMVFFK